VQSDDEAQLRRVYHDICSFVISQGPFDGLVGFSEGASVAATILIEDARRNNHDLGLKCAVLFCGMPPVDLNLDLIGKARLFSPEVDGVMIHVPTAHIYSLAGKVCPGMGADLARMCYEDTREVFIHNLGHDIPGSGSDESLREAVRVIERTVEMARAC